MERMRMVVPEYKRFVPVHPTPYIGLALSSMNSTPELLMRKQMKQIPIARKRRDVLCKENPGPNSLENYQLFPNI